ncbi:PREDICTED: nucleoplasmin-2 [Dipodomys ordii]|uniref:Nucleoplasmin-2 n=1 Tax=Dipodomys ordii TaxID=10020 RepID=A0A1S3GM32_DIPOR|nr:PREDICTED: nucleoplasmin-2 [Dipodomys ordii]
MADKETRTVLWGAELNQEKRSCTFKPQLEKKESCRLVISTICLSEKAKEELNRVEVLAPPSMEDRKSQPITIASLKPSVLPMVTMSRVELSPPVTFHLRAGSGPVFLSGQECYEISDLSWVDEEGEEEIEEEEEEDFEDEDVDVSLEDTPVHHGKRLVPHKHISVTKKKKLEKEEEAARSTSGLDKSPGKKAKITMKIKKLAVKK